VSGIAPAPLSPPSVGEFDQSKEDDKARKPKCCTFSVGPRQRVPVGLMCRARVRASPRHVPTRGAVATKAYRVTCGGDSNPPRSPVACGCLGGQLRGGPGLAAATRLSHPQTIARIDVICGRSVKLVERLGAEPAIGSGSRLVLDRYSRWHTSASTIIEDGLRAIERLAIPADASKGEIRAQFGTKVAEHAVDFGPRPVERRGSSQDAEHHRGHRTNPQRVVKGTFRGQGPGGARGPVSFRIKGEDVVVTTETGQFVTILKDGINSPSVKQALGD
jgi:hypothetical protein